MIGTSAFDGVRTQCGLPATSPEQLRRKLEVRERLMLMSILMSMRILRHWYRCVASAVMSTVASTDIARRLKTRSLAVVAVSLLAIATTTHVNAATPDTIKQRLLACTACHGDQGRATNHGYYPRIAGKPADYLYNQLQNFRQGRRQYPMMTYLVDHLSDAYLQEIAHYFADQHPPYPAPQPPDPSSATRERGDTLVHQGDASKKIPACIACHGSAMTGVLPTTPGLVGLPRDYLVSQIGAWKSGARRAAAPDCMAQIAKRLSPEDIGAVASWLAAQRVPDGATAAVPTAVKLPLACGSVPH